MKIFGLKKIINPVKKFTLPFMFINGRGFNTLL